MLYSASDGSKIRIDENRRDRGARVIYISPPYLAPRSRWIIKRMNGSGSFPR